MLRRMPELGFHATQNVIDVSAVVALSYVNYSVFHGIGNQEQGCCELVLGFQKAQGASL